MKPFHLTAHSGYALLAVWLVLACGGWASRGALLEEPAHAEYEVKAVWLLNFARHVEWPKAAFAEPTSPIVVAVVGPDPFGSALETVFAGKTVRGRPLVVKRLSPDQDFTNCHIAFFSSAEKKHYRELIEKLGTLPVLTVGETVEFDEQGGMVRFVHRAETIRFTVNLEPARRARLRVSASLLKVAVSVRGKYE